jgi:hypothetical protein
MRRSGRGRDDVGHWGPACHGQRRTPQRLGTVAQHRPRRPRPCGAGRPHRRPGHRVSGGTHERGGRTPPTGQRGGAAAGRSLGRGPCPPGVCRHGARHPRRRPGQSPGGPIHRHPGPRGHAVGRPPHPPDRGRRQPPGGSSRSRSRTRRDGERAVTRPRRRCGLARHPVGRGGRRPGVHPRRRCDRPTRDPRRGHREAGGAASQRCGRARGSAGRRSVEPRHRSGRRRGNRADGHRGGTRPRHRAPSRTCHPALLHRRASRGVGRPRRRHCRHDEGAVALRSPPHRGATAGGALRPGVGRCDAGNGTIRRPCDRRCAGPDPRPRTGQRPGSRRACGVASAAWARAAGPGQRADGVSGEAARQRQSARGERTRARSLAASTGSSPRSGRAAATTGHDPPQGRRRAAGAGNRARRDGLVRPRGRGRRRQRGPQQPLIHRRAPRSRCPPGRAELEDGR